MVKTPHRYDVQALRHAANEYLAPEWVATLYPDLTTEALVAALDAAGVSPESEWYEDLVAAHRRR